MYHVNKLCFTLRRSSSKPFLALNSASAVSPSCAVYTGLIALDLACQYHKRPPQKIASCGTKWIKAATTHPNTKLSKRMDNNEGPWFFGGGTKALAAKPRTMETFFC